MRKAQIIARLKEIRAAIGQPNADITALETEARSLRTELDQIEARSALFDGLPGEDTPPTNPIERRDNGDGLAAMTPEAIRATPEYRSAWLHRLQGRALNEAEQRAMSTAAGSAGAAVPTTTLNKIIEKLEQVTALYPKISKSAIPGNMKIPVETASQAASWHTENAAINGTDPQLDYIDLAGYELVKLVTVSIASRKMTIDAFEAYVVNQIVRKMAIAIESAIISGTGVGQPTGILVGITFTVAQNKVTYPSTGATYDTFMDALSLLPGAYHVGAIFVCNTKTKYQKIKKVKDDEGRPMFTEGMIDAKAVIVNDRLPDGKILLFNPEYYHMNSQQEITIDVSDQSGFRAAQIDYRGYALMDGKPLLDEAFVLIEQEA